MNPSSSPTSASHTGFSAAHALHHLRTWAQKKSHSDKMGTFQNAKHAQSNGISFVGAHGA
jgi:hypothetical protein